MLRIPHVIREDEAPAVEGDTAAGLLGSAQRQPRRRCRSNLEGLPVPHGLRQCPERGVVVQRALDEGAPHDRLRLQRLDLA
jgi:hypothetical protein